MRFEGRVTKDGKLWLVEVPAFDALTQGRTKREAYEMAKDLIETMANAEDFEVTIYPRGRDSFEVGASGTETRATLQKRLRSIRTRKDDAHRREAGATSRGDRAWPEDCLAYRCLTTSRFVFAQDWRSPALRAHGLVESRPAWQAEGRASCHRDSAGPGRRVHRNTHGTGSFCSRHEPLKSLVYCSGRVHQTTLVWRSTEHDEYSDHPRARVPGLQCLA